jgi:DNA topoisomerase-6 subunit B
MAPARRADRAFRKAAKSVRKGPSLFPDMEETPPAAAEPPASKSAPAKGDKRPAEPKTAPRAEVKAAAERTETAPEAKPSARHRRTAEQMAAMQREISVSEFFTKNRHLLGFDNPRKALLTAVKEGVDNSLDACEEAGILPDIRVAISAIENRDDRYKVTIEDSGPGIVPQQVPRIFAKLLYGSKFHRMKMSRGQQGIGISAAGMYGQLTTGRATRIISKTAARKKAYECELLLDTRKNEPQLVREQEIDWDRAHGTHVEMDMEAKYTRGRQSVEEYLYQVSIANPHATIRFDPPEGEPFVLQRSTNDLPPEPREIKPHPLGIELGMLISMLQTTNARSLSSFLHVDFTRVSANVARDICKRAGLPESAKPSRIARQEADALYGALQKTKLMKPPTDCVVPIGQELLLKGLKRGVEADFYHTVTRPPAVYRGNPFQIEVGLAYGGQLPADEPCRVLRFANRVPLLYQQSACAVTRAAATTAWRNYGITQSQGQLPVGPLAIVVHVASVWVPFTSESKEAIAHYPEILKEMRLALQECGRKLGIYVRHRRREADAERKRQYITKYIPHIGIALKEILHLTDKEEKQVVDKLVDMLEKSRTM